MKGAGIDRQLLNTDEKQYGDCEIFDRPSLETRQWHSSPWLYVLEITVPALSVMVFKQEA